jgi:DNA-binding response OmpR family regulator
MTTEPLRILLVEDSDDTAEQVNAMLAAADAPGHCRVERVLDFEHAWRLLLSPGEWDVVLYRLREPVEREVSRLTVTHEAAPTVPIIVLLADAERVPDGMAALAAGAEDYQILAPSRRNELVVAIHKALHRSRSRASGPGVPEVDAEIELHELGGICGPAALKVSARSLGSTSLSEREPEQYDRLIEQYRVLLDRSMNNRLFHDDEGLGEDVNLFADRLGAMSAGPRDVVELHKEAIAGRIEDQNGAKARAYVDEGRLVMLQLMGHLVSFYRGLSWGHARPSALPKPLRKPSSGAKSDIRRRRT